MIEATEAMVDAARREAYQQDIQLPYMARIRDYPGDLEGLRAADREAELKNSEAIRAVIKAALAAADTRAGS